MSEPSSRRGRRMVLKIVGITLACLLVPALALAAMSLLSRRPDNLGVTDGRLAPCPSSPNCVSSQADDAAHRVLPLPLEGTPREARQRLRSVLGTWPRVKVVTEDEHYLHAEFTSTLFRFVDDVEFLIDEAAGVIHVRSASRTGYSDFGVNRRRVEDIRTKLAAAAAP